MGRQKKIKQTKDQNKNTTHVKNLHSSGPQNSGVGTEEFDPVKNQHKSQRRQSAQGKTNSMAGCMER